jgi:hypothetical protein
MIVPPLNGNVEYLLVIPSDRWYRPNIDILGISLEGLVYVLFVVIITFPPGICCVGLDTINLLVLTYFPDLHNSLGVSYFTSIPYLFLRIVLFTAGCYEIGCAAPFFVILACAGIRFFTDAISSFTLLHDTPLVFFRRYNSYRCLQRTVENLAGMGLWGISSICLLLTVTSTFASIRLIGVIPMPIYLCAPAAALICPTIALCVIFPVVSVHEGSTQSLHRFLQKMGSKKYSRETAIRKYYLKKLHSTSAMCFYGGFEDARFLRFKRSTKKAYLEMTLYFTMNFMLSVPSDSLMGHV